jgi:hypothetical protein
MGATAITITHRRHDHRQDPLDRRDHRRHQVAMLHAG